MRYAVDSIVSDIALLENIETKELGFNIVKVKKSLLIKKSSATNE